MGRTPCCNVDGLKKGAWTSEEDQKLVSYIQEHGEGGWRTLPLKAGLQRCGKSCRLRWANYLRPDIKRGEFSPEEEERIIELHASLGNRWSAIARHLSKRTDNEIKNYWNTHLKKRLSDNIDSTSHSNKNKPLGPATSTTSADVDQQSHIQVSTSSSSAQLLNKLAAKLAEQEGEEERENDVVEVEEPLPRPMRRVGSSTSSTRLLNKIASRLAQPMHCLNTLKSILSSAADGVDSGGYGNMQRCASTSSLQSDSTAATSSDMSRSNLSNYNDNSDVNTGDYNDQDMAFLDMLDLDSVLNDDDWPCHQQQQYGSSSTLPFGGSQYSLDYDYGHGYSSMDLEQPSTTSSASKSTTTNDRVDDSCYDYGFGGEQIRADDYNHGIGGLLDGDDEHGRTFWNDHYDSHTASFF